MKTEQILKQLYPLDQKEDREKKTDKTINKLNHLRKFEKVDEIQIDFDSSFQQNRKDFQQEINCIFRSKHSVF